MRIEDGSMTLGREVLSHAADDPSTSNGTSTYLPSKPCGMGGSNRVVYQLDARQPATETMALCLSLLLTAPCCSRLTKGPSVRPRCASLFSILRLFWLSPLCTRCPPPPTRCPSMGKWGRSEIGKTLRGIRNRKASVITAITVGPEMIIVSRKMMATKCKHFHVAYCKR